MLSPAMMLNDAQHKVSCEKIIAFGRRDCICMATFFSLDYLELDKNTAVSPVL